MKKERKKKSPKTEETAQLAPNPKQETKRMKITAKAPKLNKEATVEYNIGTTLEENAELFGADKVNTLFCEQLVVKVQSGVRKCLEGDKDPQEWANTYVPGARMPSIEKSPLAAATAAVSKMSEEDRAALLAQLQAG